MPKKNEPSLIYTLVKYALIVPYVLGLIENLLLMAKDEMADAKQKVVYLFILGIFALSLIASSWFCVTALLVIFFMYLHLSLTAAIIFTAFVNFFLLLLVCLIISRIKVDVFLPETRQFIRDLFSS